VLTLCIVAVHCWNTDFKVYLILKQIKSPTINLGLFPLSSFFFFLGVCVCVGGVLLEHSFTMKMSCQLPFLFCQVLLEQHCS
jgi:hypothetical protein